MIAQGGKPMARMIPIEASTAKRRLGTVVGKGTIKLDLKTDFEVGINERFGLRL